MYIALHRLVARERSISNLKSECDTALSLISEIPNVERTGLDKLVFFLSNLYSLCILWLLFKWLFVGQTAQFYLGQYFVAYIFIFAVAVR